MKKIKRRLMSFALTVVVVLCFSILGFNKQVSASTVDSVSYSSHVMNDGWQSWVSNGEISGTTGQHKRMEAIKIQLSDCNYSGGITYRAHVMDDGWQSWVNNGQMAGTTGQCRQMEAIQIKLTGEISTYYDIYYRANVANNGWQSWVSNGEIAGTTGQCRQMEAIEIKLVKKNRRALILGETTSPAVPEKDIISMMSMMQNNTFKGDRIDTVSYKNKTKQSITSIIRNTFKCSDDSDVNYIYMTCHGGEDGSIYICCKNNENGQLVTDWDNPYTGSELKSILDQVRGKVVLMLDCCHAGSIINKSYGDFNANKFIEDFNSAKSGELCSDKYKVICSSSKSEVSRGGSLSLATKYWEKAAGWNPENNAGTVLNADTNGDSYVTLSELYQYSHKNVSTQTIVCYPQDDNFVLFANKQ